MRMASGFPARPDLASRGRHFKRVTRAVWRGCRRSNRRVGWRSATKKAVQQKAMGSEQFDEIKSRAGRRAWRRSREPRESAPDWPPSSDLLAMIEHDTRRFAGNLGAINQTETWRSRPQRTSMTLSPAAAESLDRRQ
jgi:hypothetical protein